MRAVCSRACWLSRWMCGHDRSTEGRRLGRHRVVRRESTWQNPHPRGSGTYGRLLYNNQGATRGGGAH